MKHRILFFVVITLCIGLVSASADWVLKPINYVTDPQLRQELVSSALSELYVSYPLLTETQRAKFSATDVYELQGSEGWHVTLVYDECITINVYIEFARNAAGELVRINTMNEDLYGVLEIYHSSISRADAIAIGRIGFTSMLIEQCRKHPAQADEFIRLHGISALDPAAFLIEAQFHSEYNGGLSGAPASWKLLFLYPNDATKGTNADEAPLWFVIELDAETGEVMDCYTCDFFDT